MTVTANPAATADARRDDLAGRLMAAALGALDTQAVYLGDRLGLYRSLAEEGPATPTELAERAGIHPRYAREWLEHQAVGAILDVDDTAADPDARRYTLPDGHAAVLLDPESPWLVAPVARFVMGSAQTMPALLEAYRTGEGVDWADYGPDVIEAQEALNRPQFANYVGDWIAALPDIAAKLRDGDGRVADVACGTGWSSISIARRISRRSRWTGSTSTRAPSSAPGCTPGAKASMTASRSCSPMPPTPRERVATTSSRSSRRYTTWRSRPRFSPRLASC